MRYYDNGSLYTVTVSEREVYDFASRWPCFGPRRAMWFQFDKKSGDLIDMGGDPNQDCDQSGVLALSKDAQHYGESRIK
jgi:hypothetical protein